MDDWAKIRQLFLTGEHSCQWPMRTGGFYPTSHHQSNWGLFLEPIEVRLRRFPVALTALSEIPQFCSPKFPTPRRHAQVAGKIALI